MLCDNIKNYRKAKGWSQEELAIKLNVVRQTISKWEKGLSVPDSEMLIRMAGELNISVGTLLGEPEKLEDKFKENVELKDIVAKLEVLNAQFARRTERQRKLWRIWFIFLGALVIAILFYKLADLIYSQFVLNNSHTNALILGGYDGLTNIYIPSFSSEIGTLLTVLPVAALSIIGIYQTRRQ